MLSPPLFPRGRSRPGTPSKPIMKINIPIAPSSNGLDSPEGGSYYGGGPKVAVQQPVEPPNDATAYPSSTTEKPAPKPTDALLDIRTILHDLDAGSSNGSRTEEDAIHVSASSGWSWGDDVLEELSRLGEGAGGAVHKVKDKRTGKIMARKTITTREAPMKQLLREILIISSTSHVNIIRFHGAYMSPSSSEVKVLMEYGEGGSLETVGRRIKERNAVVGEKIAGRLAEGVRPSLSDRAYQSGTYLAMLDIARPCLSA